MDHACDISPKMNRIGFGIWNKLNGAFSSPKVVPEITLFPFVKLVVGFDEFNSQHL